jgi:thermitase
MKEKIVSVLMLTLILTSMLNIAFIMKPSFAENSESSILGKDFMGKTGETTPANKAAKPDQANSFDSSWQNVFERKPDAEQDKTLESTSQTSRYNGDGWNFNDTSEWNNFAYVDGNKTRLIVGVNGEDPASLSELEKVAAKHQAKIVNTISIRSHVKAIVVELLLVSVTAFVEDVRVVGFVSYIEPNMKVQAQLVPNDPYWSIQWGPRKIEADWAWNTTVGNPSVLVAVIDTGIYYYHEDIAANYVPLGYDWVNMDSDPLDDHGHGTHCAGIIAAVLNNNVGIAGLAQVRVMAEKVLDMWGGGYWDWVASGIIHATESGADIISMSLGEYGYSELVHEAVRYAYDSGVLIIAAAGNENTNAKLYPAGLDEVIAVAATDQYDGKAWFSNWGDWIELAAPGVDIISTVPWGYTSWSGTSMATPHVSGVAALVWGLYPSKTRDWVRLWLRYTADDLGDPGFDVVFGYGRINARKAVEQTPPVHELIAYEWKTPPYLEPDALGTINATILNFGESDETEVTVQLLANGTMVDFALIGFLASGDSKTVSLAWNPAVEGLYNVTLYVVPVPSETSLENNVLWEYIYVGFPVKAVVLHSAGNIIGDIITNWQVLNSEWHRFGDTMVYIDYTTLNKEDITYEDIASTEADVLIISCAYDPWMGWQFTDSEIEAITRYVYEGHGLIATAGTLYYYVPNNNKLAPLFGLNETITWYDTWTDLLHIEEPDHPLFVKVPNPFVFRQVATNIPSDWRWDANELIDGEYMARGHFKESAIVVRRGLVYISPWLEIIPPYYHHHLQLLYNAITWSRYQKPQHELIVSLEAPQALKPGESALLNATISNIGLSNETVVELQLLINGVVINSTTIPELWAGDSYTLRHLWTPTVEGTYNVTAYAIPVPSEDDITNNIKSVRVFVSALSVALFQNWDPWDYPSNEEALNRYGVPYVVFSSSDFGRIDLSAFTKVVIASDQDQAFYNGMDTYRWWFEDYVSNGGILEVHAADGGRHGGSWVGPLPGGLQWASYYGQYVTVVDPTHAVLTTPNMITEGELDNWNYAVHGYFSTYPEDAHIIIIEDSTRMPAYLEFGYGSGVIAASSQTLEWAYKRRLGLILENSLLYTPIKYEHDVAVTLKASAFVEPSSSVLLNATVRNRGSSNETDVELELLIDGATVDSVVVSELASGSSYTLSYSWSPTIEGVYNVTAHVPSVENETFVANNIATKFVTVTQPLIRPLEGQYANYTMYYSVGLWNFTYLQYVSPHQINVTTWMRDPSNYTQSGWMIVNIFTRMVEKDSGIYWTGMWYPGWIETNVTLGSTINLLWGNATIVDSQVILVGVRPIDCWEIHIEYYGYFYKFWYDKASGLWIAMEFTGPSKVYLILTATNVPIGFLYEHDLAVILDTPPHLQPSESTILNATVYNIGLSDEADVTLQIIINDTVVDNVTISALPAGEHYTLPYPWTPTVEAIYNVTAYAPPVLGENASANNVARKMVLVRYLPKLLVVDTPLPEDTGALDMLGIEYTLVTPIEFATVDLYQYNVLFIGWEPGDTLVDALLARAPEIADWVAAGNGIVALAEFYEANRWAWLPLFVNGSSGFHEDTVHILNPAHPVMSNLTDTELSNWGNSYHGYFFSYDPSWEALAEGVEAAQPITLATTYGAGRIAITDQDPDYHFYYDRREGAKKLLRNMIEWATPHRVEGVHDVAVTDVAVSSNIVYQGWIVDVNVTAANFGNATENFMVTLYYDSTVIATQNVLNLEPNATLTLSFNWNTTNVPCCHNYTMNAVASTVPGETNTDNNIFVDGTVKIKILGDVNGDGKVSITDVILCINAFGSTPSLPGWDPNADVNGDGKVNIVDIVLTLKNFGKTC